MTPRPATRGSAWEPPQMARAAPPLARSSHRRPSTSHERLLLCAAPRSSSLQQRAACGSLPEALRPQPPAQRWGRALTPRPATRGSAWASRVVGEFKQNSCVLLLSCSRKFVFLDVTVRKRLVSNGYCTFDSFKFTLEEDLTSLRRPLRGACCATRILVDPCGGFPGIWSLPDA
jgi:hypothetical protein